MVDIEFKRVVTEYRARILENELGQRFVTKFPKDVNSGNQYGNGLKAHAVYLSQYQLLPYDQIREYFTDQLDIPLSSGSLLNSRFLGSERQDTLRHHYQNILKAGEKESPAPIPVKGKRGRPNRTKSRNLLERLQNYESDVLRFMTYVAVPFTNNPGENYLRMARYGLHSI